MSVSDERRPFFTPKALARYLSVSDRQTRRMLAEGAIPSYKVGGSRRIDPNDVDAFLRERRDN